MVQGDHFGETGSHSVLWDKVTAGAIPEPAATAFTAALAARGLASYPSPGEILLKDDPYFNGAYDIEAHGSRDKSRLDAVQLEVPGPMRDTPEHRAATAQAVAESLEAYFDRHFLAKLR